MEEDGVYNLILDICDRMCWQLDHFDWMWNGLTDDQIDRLADRLDMPAQELHDLFDE